VFALFFGKALLIYIGPQCKGVAEDFIYYFLTRDETEDWRRSASGIIDETETAFLQIQETQSFCLVKNRKINAKKRTITRALVVQRGVGKPGQEASRREHTGKKVGSESPLSCREAFLGISSNSEASNRPLQITRIKQELP
jgi:hypothetical protein